MNKISYLFFITIVLSCSPNEKKNILLSKASFNYEKWLEDENYNILNAYQTNNLDSLLSISDGIVLTGGEDINPLMYDNASNLYLCEMINHYRDTLEKLIFDYALNNSIPTIGICRGMQMINVAAGGSLYADIPTQIGNAVTHRNNGEVNHSIYLVDPQNNYNSLIFPKNDTSSSFNVNSWHHQGLNDLAKGVIVLARSNDMLPEAIVLDSNLHPFMIAVQFHPERLGGNNGISITMRDNFFKAINKK